MFDEVPLKAKVESVAGLAKLVQSEYDWALLLYHPTTKKHIFLRGCMSTWIQSVDRNIAECYRECLRRLVERTSLLNDVPWCRMRLTVCDGASANDREVRYFAQEHPTWISSKYVCQIHKEMGVATKTADLADADVSGLLHLVLSLSQIG